jgi:flavorubredoxin
MTDLLETGIVMVGSPTLNNGMLPTVGKFLTYLKGLRPAGRTGLAFGSYGWGGQAPGEIEEVLEGIGWDLPVEKIRINYIPSEKELKEAAAGAKELIDSIGKDE